MRIRAIELQGIRNLPNKTWDLPSRSEADIVVVTGPRGSGKTTFLDAIIAAKEKVAPYGGADARWGNLLPSGQRSAKVRLFFELGKEERERLGAGDELVEIEAIFGESFARNARPSRIVQTLLGRWADEPHGRFVYFHDGRALNGPLQVAADRAAKTNALTTRNSKFAHVYDLLSDPSRGGDRERANTLLQVLCPTLTFLGISNAAGVQEPLLLRASGDRAHYSQLSSSEREAALFALAFVRPQINDSIILLDRPEAAFGDRGALELVNAILRFGPTNQLVLATGSAELVAAVPRERVIEVAA